MRTSFVIRIEALDGLKDLHTIAVYPKIVSCRATLAKYLNALFDQTWNQVGIAIEQNLERNLETLRQAPTTP